MRSDRTIIPMQYNKTDDQSYNGWSNRETWLVNLWLTNDQGTYSQIKDLIDQAKDRYQGAQAIQDFVQEFNPLAEDATLYCDLLNTALSAVDWFEIADAFADINA